MTGSWRRAELADTGGPERAGTKGKGADDDDPDCALLALSSHGCPILSTRSAPLDDPIQAAAIRLSSPTTLVSSRNAAHLPLVKPTDPAAAVHTLLHLHPDRNLPQLLLHKPAAAVAAEDYWSSADDDDVAARTTLAEDLAAGRMLSEGLDVEGVVGSTSLSSCRGL